MLTAEQCESLVAKATAISRVGKNARNKLKAIACEITPHRGNTRANIPYARRRSRAAKFIAGHYTFQGQSCPNRCTSGSGFELGQA